VQPYLRHPANGLSSRIACTTKLAKSRSEQVSILATRRAPGRIDKANCPQTRRPVGHQPVEGREQDCTFLKRTVELGGIEALFARDSRESGVLAHRNDPVQLYAIRRYRRG